MRSRCFEFNRIQLPSTGCVSGEFALISLLRRKQSLELAYLIDVFKLRAGEGTQDEAAIKLPVRTKRQYRRLYCCQFFNEANWRPRHATFVSNPRRNRVTPILIQYCVLRISR